MNEYSHCVGCNAQEKVQDLDYDGYCASCILEEQELNRMLRDDDLSKILDL